MGKNASAVPPPKATQLTIVVQTPFGGDINDVEVEVNNLRLKGTGAASNRVVFQISDAEHDTRVLTQGGNIIVKARKTHFGPPVAKSTKVVPGEASTTFAFPKGLPSVFTMVLQDVALNRYDDLFATIAVRALTRRQARDALLCLHRRGDIKLIPEPTFKHTADATCTTKCKVLNPLVGERVGMKPTVLQSVVYLHINNAVMPAKRADVTTSAGDLVLLDVRHGVGLVRLARSLKTSFGATAITHIGISGALPSIRKDNHGQGRAIDFGGVRGIDPTVAAGAGAYDLFIFYDWGKQSVPNLADPTKPRLAQWPGGDRTLVYRLDPLPPGGSDLARRMFQAVYDFAVVEYNDKTNNATQTAPASRIGEGGRVMNPDHFSSDPTGPNGREAHIGHLHIQVGDTGTEPAPAIEAEP